jgi:Flp pilus assembly protein TadG
MNIMAKVLAKYRRDERGIAAIEFAFIFPLMALLFFGSLDLIQFITFSRHLNGASAVVSDLVTANEGTVSAAQVSDYYNAAYIFLAPIPSAQVRVELYNFKSDNSLRWQQNNGQGAACGAAPTGASVSSMTTDGNDVLVTRVCAEYKPFFGEFYGVLLGNAAIKMTKSMFERPRLSSKLCYNTVSC